jgi:UDP-2,3-diacylglucosamine hydrolase
MTTHTLFIADLHLSVHTPRITQHCLDFLTQRAIFAEKLYILGDLFEVWLGDDNEDYQTVKHALRTLTASGVAVNILHGNRDFLLGMQFATDTGCHLMAEPQVIDLYGVPTLLMHGDVLCTQDVAYQAFRQQVRDPRWQQQFLAQPLAQRRLLAQQARQQSQQYTHATPEAMMDVTPEEVIKLLQAHQVYELIHGHTHRPALHKFEVAGRQANRYVLGAWQPHQAIILQVSANSLKLFDWLASNVC